MTGDWDLAEESAQDAFELALQRWARDGIPCRARGLTHHGGTQPRGGADATATDWTQIAALYRQLATLVPSAVVELNRAVAVGMADGPAAGLALVDALDASGTLAGYHLLPATRADLLRRLGRFTEAAAAYRRALELVTTEPERRYLTRRLAAIPSEA